MFTLKRFGIYFYFIINLVFLSFIFFYLHALIICQFESREIHSSAT